MGTFQRILPRMMPRITKKGDGRGEIVITGNADNIPGESMI